MNQLAEVHAELLSADILGVLVVFKFLKSQRSNFGEALYRLNSSLDWSNEFSKQNLDELCVKYVVHWDPRKIRLESLEAGFNQTSLEDVSISFSIQCTLNHEFAELVNHTKLFSHLSFELSHVFGEYVALGEVENLFTKQPQYIKRVFTFVF